MVFIRGTSERFRELNPILSADEVGVETDTRYCKAGDNENDWSSLNYYGLPVVEIGRVPSGLDNEYTVGQIWWNTSGTQKTYQLSGFSDDLTPLALWETIGTRADIRELE